MTGMNDYNAGGDVISCPTTRIENRYDFNEKDVRIRGIFTTPMY